MIELHRIDSFHIIAYSSWVSYLIPLDLGTTLAMSLVVDTLASGYAPLSLEPCVENVISWQSLHNTWRGTDHSVCIVS